MKFRVAIVASCSVLLFGCGPKEQDKDLMVCLFAAQVQVEDLHHVREAKSPLVLLGDGEPPSVVLALRFSPLAVPTIGRPMPDEPTFRCGLDPKAPIKTADGNEMPSLTWMKDWAANPVSAEEIANLNVLIGRAEISSGRLIDPGMK
jgi:hypothetical protein